MKRGNVVVQRRVEELLGWPTDTFSIDWGYDTTANEGGPSVTAVHTVLVFVPGNPGLVEWYIPFFAEILKSIGPGYAVRGAAHAGHSTDPQKINVENDNRHDTSSKLSPKSIAWTVDGQLHHKMEYIDKTTQQMNDDQRTDKTTKDPIKFILVGHSFGCHLVQRILMIRPDILACTVRCIYLMPFIRMDAPPFKQKVLDCGAENPVTVIRTLETIFRVILSRLPTSVLEKLLESSMDKSNDRAFTADLLKQPLFPRNFMGLGSEEIRDIPQIIDICALRHIVNRHGVSVDMLFAGNDHWSPDHHVSDLQALMDRNVVSAGKLSLMHNTALRHDFVTSNEQTRFVVNYCIKLLCKGPGHLPLSRL